MTAEELERTIERREMSRLEKSVPLRKRVLEHVRKAPGIKRSELSDLLKVDVKTISRAVAALGGLVEHRGSKKTGGYYAV